MTYDPKKFAFERVYGAAMLGWTAVLGQMRLGLADNQHEVIPVSTVTIADGYTVEQTGELSIDPAVGTATFAVRADGPPTPTVALRVGDKVEVSYDGVVLFDGAVTQVSCSLEAAADELSDYVNRITYSIASMETVLLSAVVSWDSLPEESALTRLRRWFTVDVSDVSPSHYGWMNTTVPAETDAGSATMLDLARAFTTATMLPLRMASHFAPVWHSLAAFDTSIDWDDQPLTGVAAGLDAAHEWATAAEFATQPGQATFTPSSISVKANDTRLAGGQTTETITPAYLGTTFRLGTSRLGSTGPVWIGFRAPGVIDGFGQPVAVSRVTQTFTTTSYGAALEIAPTLHLPAVRT